MLYTVNVKNSTSRHFNKQLITVRLLLNVKAATCSATTGGANSPQGAEKWFTDKFNTITTKARSVWPGGSAAGPGGDQGSDDDKPRRCVKRQKTSAADFFAESESEADEAAPPGVTDELTEYLALPQIQFKTERDATE